MELRSEAVQAKVISIGSSDMSRLAEAGKGEVDGIRAAGTDCRLRVTRKP